MEITATPCLRSILNRTQASEMLENGTNEAQGTNLMQYEFQRFASYRTLTGYIAQLSLGAAPLPRTSGTLDTHALTRQDRRVRELVDSKVLFAFVCFAPTYMCTSSPTD